MQRCGLRVSSSTGVSRGSVERRQRQRREASVQKQMQPETALEELRIPCGESESRGTALVRCVGGRDRWNWQRSLKPAVSHNP